MWNRLVPPIVALVVTVAVIAFVKFALMPALSSSGSRTDEIWAIGATIIVTLIGAFFVQEILAGAGKFIEWMRDRPNDPPADKPDRPVHPMHLILSLAASVLIVIAAKQWL